MRKGSGFFLFISMFLTLSQAYSAGGYLGENPGFDFYSKIDDNIDTIEQKLVTTKLRETPRLDQFAKSCDGKLKKYLTGKITDEKLLSELQGQYYGGLSKLLASEKGITTDQFASLARCLSDSYTSVQNRVHAEQERREITSRAGLYSDGDTGNSEYDIITDIEKINDIIFSTPLKYTGTKNVSSKSLANIIAGNNPAESMSPTLVAFLGGDRMPDPSAPPITNQTSPTSPTETPPSLSDLIGSTCTDPSSISGPIDGVSDNSFTTELASVIAGYEPLSNGGYSASTRPTSPQAISSPTSLTGGADFFDKMPCGPGAMFCIDVKTIPGGNITLGGGRSYSIESVLDKYSKHLYPISESDLSYKRMTNQNAQSTEKNAKFTIAGLRVFLAEKGQRTRVDKNEETPARTQDKLQAMLDCASIVSGLPADAREANTLAGAGFRMTASTTDRQLPQTQPIGPQETIQAIEQMNCYQNYMNEGRRIYANSFSQDIADFQAFTHGLLTEIQDIMRLLGAMDKKPTY